MVGIGITTRNRPEVLDYTLSQFVKYRDRNQDIVVFDDFSDNRQRVDAVCEKYGIDFMYHSERLGIAKSKNELIKEFVDHEGMILFDDDCFPTADGWYEHFLRAHKNHKQHHMIYAREPQIMLAQRFRYADSWMGCLGVCVWLSKYAIQKVGGWDPRFGIYGVEHHELTGRCRRAGLSPLGHYMTPRDMSTYIWCFDTDGDHYSCGCGWQGGPVKDYEAGDTRCPNCGGEVTGFDWIHRSCMDEEEKRKAIDENVKIAQQMVDEQNKNVFRNIYD